VTHRPFGSALEARGIDASHGRLVTEVSGEIELEDRILIIKRIHAHYRLAAKGADNDTIERVHSFHAERCPVARSIGHGIVITTSYEIV
jgi:uncharacterized OsmC-like protein